MLEYGEGQYILYGEMLYPHSYGRQFMAMIFFLIIKAKVLRFILKTLQRDSFCVLKREFAVKHNLASGVETQIDDLASHIIKLTNSKSEVILGPKRMWDESGNGFGDPSKSLKELNFKAKLSIETVSKKQLVGLTITLKLLIKS